MKTLEDLETEWDKDRYYRAIDRVAKKMLTYGRPVTTTEMATIAEMLTNDRDATDILAAFRTYCEPPAGIKKTEDLTWTDKIPTEPGWYWAANTTGLNTAPVIIEMSAFTGRGLMIRRFGSSEWNAVIEWDFFYGPIEPPVLPDKPLALPENAKMGKPMLKHYAGINDIAAIHSDNLGRRVVLCNSRVAGPCCIVYEDNRLEWDSDEISAHDMSEWMEMLSDAKIAWEHYFGGGK